MNDDFVGFDNSIVDFGCIDDRVFEYTFERCLDGFEKLWWFFFDRHLSILFLMI
jgi:hypothetical protein